MNDKDYYISYSKDERDTYLRIFKLLSIEVVDEDVMKSGNGEFLVGCDYDRILKVKEIKKIVDR